ncbi:MAG: hypothetical protein JRG90_08300 [Deltaproteobacteria bacterium]|nr:hypothetical protein [Deltaproteobacteria bacterium]
MSRGSATWRSIGLALVVGVACTGTAAGAVAVRVPAAGAELTWMPVSIEIAFDASADTGTLSVSLNGNDISSAFAFSPPNGGEIVATAVDVWDGFVVLGSNQIDVSIEIGGAPVLAGSSFDAMGDPYADEVVSYTQGANGGYNANLLPAVALGPPVGAGLWIGSVDVVSLGNGGSIVVRFADNVIVDGPGVDFTVFENPFMLIAGDGYSAPPFAEPGRVKVSQNGTDWAEFPCTLTSAAGPYWPGCTGIYPVFSDLGLAPNPHPSIPTTTPIEDLVDQDSFTFQAPPGSGGDSFDLADVGLAWVRYVKVESTTFQARSASLGQSGPDIDAVVAVHSSPEEPPAIPVPALSRPGLLAIFVLLAGVAHARLRRAGQAR